MKKQIFKIILVSFTIFGFFSTAHAALNIDATVDVPQNCVATDTDGVTHDYGSSYLAICAFEKALSNGSISSIQLSNQYPSLGLFVTSINNVAADPNNQYWALYQNGNYASSGLTQLPVATDDILMFQLHDFSDNSTGDQVTVHIHSLTTTSLTPSGSGPLITYTIPTTPPVTPDTVPITQPVSPITTTAATDALSVTPQTFDLKKALDFLVTQQKDDGSFGENLYTDWSALALTSGNYQDQIIKLIKYLTETKKEKLSLTDNERHAMSLMSLGLNPYNTNGINYIDKIINSFDGKQFGDTKEDNDDIFALIVLQNAGYSIDEKMINDDISFILSRQKDNGSFDGSVDMTGAAIEALSVFKQNEQVKNSLTKAREFLKQNQKDNGGWGNASSTAWVLEGITALGEKPEDWKKDDPAKDGASNTPLDYLTTIQDTDGGIKDENIDTKIWKTAYVTSILSGKTWNQIMKKFEKPIALPATPQIAKKVIRKQLLTASAITAVTPLPSPAKEEIPQKSWFVKLLENIFGF
ncbi:MAG: prenyltransferase/squalene oxidase repeat-containing protein [Candidatus Paceibacterota bacterium]|jgi:hypothetical protein